MSVINPKTGRKIKIGGRAYRSCCLEQMGGKLIPIEVLTILGQSQIFEVDGQMMIRDLIDLILAKHQSLWGLDLSNLKQIDLIYHGQLLRSDVPIGDYLGKVVDEKGPYELYIFPRMKVIRKRHDSVELPSEEPPRVCLTFTPEYGKMKEPDLSFLKKNMGREIGGVDTYPDGTTTKFYSSTISETIDEN